MKAPMFYVFVFLMFWSDKVHCDNSGNATVINVSVELSIFNFTKSAIPDPVNIQVANGTTAFEILQLAATQNPCYKAEYKIFRNLGRFITSICGVEQNKNASLFWLIYINDRLANVGVDKLKPKNGDRLTFKYQMILSRGGNSMAVRPRLAWIYIGICICICRLVGI